MLPNRQRVDMIGQNITIGQDADEVRALIGEPETVVDDDGGQCWTYQSGRLLVFFDERSGKVIRKIVTKAQTGKDGKRT